MHNLLEQLSLETALDPSTVVQRCLDYLSGFSTGSSAHRAWPAVHAYTHFLRQRAHDQAVMDLLRALPPAQGALFRSANLALEMHSETLTAQDYLRGHTEPLLERMGRARAYALHEAHTLQMQAGQTVHIVGSGPVPLTALIYFTEKQVHIHCIDYDHEALALSREVATQFLGNQDTQRYFRFTHADATHCAFGDSAIRGAIVTAHCDHKVAILRNLHGLCHPQARILLRPVRGLYQLIYPPLPQGELDAHFHIDTTPQAACSTVVSPPWVLTPKQVPHKPQGTFESADAPTRK